MNSFPKKCTIEDEIQSTRRRFFENVIEWHLLSQRVRSSARGVISTSADVHIALIRNNSHRGFDD